MQNSKAKIMLFLLLFIIFQSSIALTHDMPLIVQDVYDVPMVFVPSGIAKVGTTLAEEVKNAKSYELKIIFQG